MKKLLTQTLVLAIVLAITVTTFAQSPNNSTRQRRTSTDGTQPATSGTNATDKAIGTSSDKSVDAKDEKDKDKPKNPDVTSDAKTNTSSIRRCRSRSIKRVRIATAWSATSGLRESS